MQKNLFQKFEVAINTILNGKVSLIYRDKLPFYFPIQYCRQDALKKTVP